MSKLMGNPIKDCLLDFLYDVPCLPLEVTYPGKFMLSLFNMGWVLILILINDYATC
jgi:hypothetical protein